MRYENVKVKRDTQTIHNSLVRPWEVPILEIIFEDGNVEALGTFEHTLESYPDPAAEYARLVQAYGADVKSGVPHVATAYGESARGIRELKRAIDESQADELKAKRNGKSHPIATPKARRTRPEMSDPLTA